LMKNEAFGNLRIAIESPYAAPGGAPFHNVGHQGIGGEVCTARIYDYQN
jgi:hypothetical protein